MAETPDLVTSRVVRYWLDEIADAKKREEDFRKDGQRVLDLYGGEKDTPFNILYSNVETLLPALYSAVPRPVVSRRFKDADPLGKAAALAGQRLLEFLVDTNVEGYETFDEGVRGATLDALLPGRGVTCVKYDASVTGAEETTEYVASELVCVETRSWNRVFFGYAKKWSKVPWVAYEEQIDRVEAERLFGSDLAGTLTYTEHDHGDRDDEPRKATKEDRHQGARKTVCVYQIWDKDGGRKIRYISSQYPDGPLKVEDDPLALTGFFNCPRPLQFVEKTNDRLPTALYRLYENQAKELNRLTLRINKVAEAIKVRGCYAGDVSVELSKIFSGEDNALVAAESSSSLAFEKGLQNAIWLVPIDLLMLVLEKLYLAREQCKRVIYEITGISDIIRGSSVASETATAQNLKSQWGTLRLKRLQKEVHRYARDLLRMMLEVAATKFNEETWAKMTGLPFLTMETHAQLTTIAQAAQQMAQANPQIAQQQPEAAKQVQQVMQQLQAPQWTQVLEMLRTDTQRAYRIDIETNSTIEPEAAEDQKNISELMNAMGQFLNGVAPLVAKGVMPFGVAQSMLLTIARRFRFGSEIEEDIKAMQAPAPEGEADKAAQQAEMQQAQMEGQLKLQEQQLKLKVAQMQATLDEQKAQADAKRMQRESDIDAQLAVLELDLKREEHRMKMEELKSKHEVGMAAGKMKIEQMKQQQKQKVGAKS